MPDPSILPLVPSPPHFGVPWDDLNASFGFIRDLRRCAQDPIHHAEGDVWIHQEMVLEALAEDEAWRALPDTERSCVFWAALLHDIAKPKTTEVQTDGRVTARGHSQLGCRMARELLWDMNLDFPSREAIANIVRFHQVPFWLLERDDAERQIIRLSQTTRCDWLALVARADIRGRHCADRDSILERIELFEEMARDQQCLNKPRAFASPVTRYRYCRGLWHQPDVAPFETFRSRVTLMSGLPGAGKDHWIETQGPNVPVVSLDSIRRRLKIAPSAKQGAVVHAARDEARKLLRRGAPFIWNATNISLDLRERCRRLFMDYDAHVTLQYVEAPKSRLYRQNANRQNPVPTSALEKLVRRWDVPTPFEAHDVRYAVG